MAELLLQNTVVFKIKKFQVLSKNTSKEIGATYIKGDLVEVQNRKKGFHVIFLDKDTDTILQGLIENKGASANESCLDIKLNKTSVISKRYFQH